MKKELDTSHPNAGIFILGVNGAEYPDTKFIYEGRDLPWLLDTKQADWWGNWGAVFRDVIILDRDGNEAGVFNLTEHNLDDPDEYEALKTLLLDISEN